MTKQQYHHLEGEVDGRARMPPLPPDTEAHDFNDDMSDIDSQQRPGTVRFEDSVTSPTFKYTKHKPAVSESSNNIVENVNSTD